MKCTVQSTLTLNIKFDKDGSNLKKLARNILKAVSYSSCN